MSTTAASPPAGGAAYRWLALTVVVLATTLYATTIN